MTRIDLICGTDHFGKEGGTAKHRLAAPRKRMHCNETSQAGEGRGNRDTRRAIQHRSHAQLFNPLTANRTRRSRFGRPGDRKMPPPDGAQAPWLSPEGVPEDSCTPSDPPGPELPAAPSLVLDEDLERAAGRDTVAGSLGAADPVAGSEGLRCESRSTRRSRTNDTAGPAAAGEAPA